MWTNKSIKKTMEREIIKNESPPPPRDIKQEKREIVRHAQVITLFMCTFMN